LLARTYQWWGVRKRLRVAGSGLWRDLTAGIPCLMYHAFTVGEERPSRFVVGARAVREQLQWLHRQGHQQLTVHQVAASRGRGELFDARRTVVLTIDDGYAEVIDTVAPALEQFDQKATLLLATGSVGEKNRWDAEGPLAGRRILSWQQVRDWAENGNEVGSHGVSHRSLDAIPPAAAAAEVTDSIEDLERELGVRPSTFSLPYGNQAEDLPALDSFDAVLGAEEGLNHPAVPMTRVRRTEICGGDGLLTFRLKLRLGYNQVDPLSLLRRIKRNLVPRR
jgi:peptidoglycan/xylan/chitin deacetylase (PgdA/CDA1 family)